MGAAVRQSSSAGSTHSAGREKAAQTMHSRTGPAALGRGRGKGRFR